VPSAYIGDVANSFTLVQQYVFLSSYKAVSIERIGEKPIQGVMKFRDSELQKLQPAPTLTSQTEKQEYLRTNDKKKNVILDLVSGHAGNASTENSADYELPSDHYGLSMTFRRRGSIVDSRLSAST